MRERDIEGYTYGDKKLFEKRHKAILEWIECYEQYVYQPDIKFEKERVMKKIEEIK